MKFRPTQFLNIPYRVSCFIKLYSKLFSCMRPIGCDAGLVVPPDGIYLNYNLLSTRSHATNVAPSGGVIYLSVPR